MSQLLHATDVLSTLLDFIRMARPDEYRRNKLEPLYGKSWKPYLTGESSAPVRGCFDAVGFEMFECRTVIKGEWKLIFMAPPYGKNERHLYNLAEDPREMTDRPADEPDKFEEMTSEWTAYAASVGDIEWSDPLKGSPGGPIGRRAGQ